MLYMLEFLTEFNLLLISRAYNIKMKQGFTLIELSIVLVIIGLLVGGILVAQSLISSASVQSQIRQLQQLEIAYYGFESRYRSIPGDSKLFQDPGDGDGLIENDKTAGHTTLFSYQLAEEKANFWVHLSDSGMISKSLGDFVNTPTAPLDYEPGVNAPEAAIRTDSVVTLFHTGAGGSSCSSNGTMRAFWLISGVNAAGGMTVAEAAAIDIKLDDGQGYGCSSNRKTVYSPGTSCAGSGGPNSGPYELNQEQDCMLAVEIGVTTDQ